MSASNPTSFRTTAGDGYVDVDALQIAGTTVTGSDVHQLVNVAKVTLDDAGTGGGVISWANPETSSIIITRIIIDVTTAATAAATIDVGTTASSATTSSDTLLDGLDVNAATGTFDNITDKGTNGKSRQKLASGKWVTASQASGDVTGLAGSAYIYYILA